MFDTEMFPWNTIHRWEDRRAEDDLTLGTSISLRLLLSS